MSNVRGLSAIVRDIFIVILIPIIVLFIIPKNGSDVIMTAGFSNLIGIPIAFFISGCLTKENRFQHLGAVAIIVWLASIINVFLFKELNFAMWLGSSLFLIACMLIGGGFSLLFVPNKRNTNTDLITHAPQQIQKWFFGLVIAVGTNIMKDLIIKAMSY